MSKSSNILNKRARNWEPKPKNKKKKSERRDNRLKIGRFVNGVFLTWFQYPKDWYIPKKSIIFDYFSINWFIKKWMAPNTSQYTDGVKEVLHKVGAKMPADLTFDRLDPTRELHVILVALMYKLGHHVEIDAQFMEQIIGKRIDIEYDQAKQKFIVKMLDDKTDQRETQIIKAPTRRPHPLLIAAIANGRDIKINRKVFESLTANYQITVAEDEDEDYVVVRAQEAAPELDDAQIANQP